MQSITFKFNLKQNVTPFVSLTGCAAQQQKNLEQFELK